MKLALAKQVKKNLYSQTVRRLRRDLDLEHPAGRWSIFEVQTQNPDLPQQLNHLLEQWDRPELRGFPRRTALITVLKNRQRISGLVQALKHLELGARPCMIIDDEADQHGLNTRVRQADDGAPYSAVYGALLDLRAILPHHTYIQYTATPQAVLLISVMDSLSPQFGAALSAGVGYCGGSSFFDTERVEGLIRTIPEGDLLVADDEPPIGPPDSLLESLRLFYVGVAIQALHRADDKPTQSLRSMLVHPSMLQMDHLRFKNWIATATDSWISVLDMSPGSPDRDELVDEFRSSYEDLAKTVMAQLQNNSEHETMPQFDEVVKYLPSSMLNTRIWEVNSRLLEQWTPHNWQAAPSHILVGGENLGRGFTVEGLTTTYMPRGRGSGIADTIQQRGRFFGYKQNYLGLCRVFLPADVMSDYENYIQHENHVMEEIGELSESGSSMLEWRRRMLLVQSLRPTRRSVMPDIYRHLAVKEWTQQVQPWTPTNDDDVEENWKIIEEFLDGLEFLEAPGSDQRTNEQRNAVAKDVSLERVFDKLLLPMSVSRFDAPKFSAVELAIRWYIKRMRRDRDGTAVVYRMAAQREPLIGGGKRRRGIRTNFRVINLFQGAAPVRPASQRGSVYPGDRYVHAIDELTVQIHDLDLTEPARPYKLLRGHVPAIAVWLPSIMRVGVFEEMAN